MKHIWMQIATISAILIFLTSCSKHDDSFVLKGPYLGQKSPGMTPEIFAPGIVCTPKNEGYIVFLNSGRVLIFDHWSPNSSESNPYYISEIRGGKWTKPQPATFTQNPYDPDLSITPDERTLFFAARRSLDGKSIAKTGWDIWFTKWTDKGFSKVRRLNEPVSSEQRDAWASVTKTGTLYFMSNREGGYGKWDIYRGEYKNGKYSKVENIGRPINTENSEADPAVAPDESYLIYCSLKPGGYGGLDLYITSRKSDGSWTASVNMGEEINTPANEEKPYITSDGKYLFFSNDKSENLDIYWVDARIISRLKPTDLK